MQANHSARRISQIYLTLVPFLGLVIAFAFGHSSYKIYLPIWLMHACLMLLAAWTLGGHLIQGQDVNKKRLAVIGMFLVVPWVLISIFAGIGPLPASASEWAATATEQQMRYYILISAGITAACGFMLLREHLRANGENTYSLLGGTAVVIATPLFMVDKAGNPVLPGTYRSIATERISQANSEIFTKDHNGNRMLALTVPKLENGVVEVVTMENQKQRIKVVTAKN
jgi:hypothetical protein